MVDIRADLKKKAESLIEVLIKGPDRRGGGFVKLLK